MSDEARLLTLAARRLATLAMRSSISKVEEAAAWVATQRSLPAADREALGTVLAELEAAARQLREHLAALAK